MSSSSGCPAPPHLGVDWVRIGVVRGAWLGATYPVITAAAFSIGHGLSGVVAGMVLGLFLSPLGLACGIVVGAIVAAAAEGITRAPGARSPQATAVLAVLAVTGAVSTVIVCTVAARAGAVDVDGGTVDHLAFWVLGPAVMGLLSLMLRPLRDAPAPEAPGPGQAEPC